MPRRYMVTATLIQGVSREVGPIPVREMQGRFPEHAEAIAQTSRDGQTRTFPFWRGSIYFARSGQREPDPKRQLARVMRALSAT